MYLLYHKTIVSNCLSDKNKRFKTMRAVLLLLEEGNQRLQDAILKELAHGTTGYTSKHRHQYGAIFCLQA